MEHENIKELFRFNYEYFINAEKDLSECIDYRLKLETYKVIRHTPKGFKILVDFKEKFVLIDSNNFYGFYTFEAKKRFAYPTKKQALKGFYQRKLSELAHLNRRKEVTKKVLEITKKELEENEEKSIN